MPIGKSCEQIFHLYSFITMNNYYETSIKFMPRIIFNLNDILYKVKSGNNLSWKILWISGLGRIKELGPLPYLEEKINNSDDGIFYNWNELQFFGSNTIDLHEFLLIGDLKKENLHRYDNDKDMKCRCNYCIELIDSSHWEISTNIKDYLTTFL